MSPMSPPVSSVRTMSSPVRTMSSVSSPMRVMSSPMRTMSPPMRTMSPTASPTISPTNVGDPEKSAPGAGERSVRSATSPTAVTESSSPPVVDPLLSPQALFVYPQPHLTGHSGFVTILNADLMYHLSGDFTVFPRFRRHIFCMGR